MKFHRIDILDFVMSSEIEVYHPKIEIKTAKNDISTTPFLQVEYGRKNYEICPTFITIQNDLHLAIGSANKRIRVMRDILLKDVRIK